jgi:hypothetical protein
MDAFFDKEKLCCYIILVYICSVLNRKVLPLT